VRDHGSKNDHGLYSYPEGQRNSALSRAGVGMKVTVVSQYFYPEETSTAELLFDLSRALVRRGVKVCAIAALPAYHGAGKAPREEVVNGVHIHRVWGTQANKNTKMGRALNTSTFSLSVALFVLLDREKSPLLIVTCPPQAIWIGLLARVVCGRRFILLMHDVYPDIAVALRALSPLSPITWLWRILNRRAFGCASSIITLGRCMRERVAGYLPSGQRDKLVVIPNWSPGTDVRPMQKSKNPLIAELGLRGKFVVQYSGNIGLVHEIHTVLAAAEKLIGSDVHFLFIGTGGQRELVAKAARQLRNVTLLPFQSRSALPISITACDVGLVTLKRGVEGLCVPSKVYRIMAAGKPVIAVMDVRTEVAETVRSALCGFVCPPGEPDHLVKVLRHLARSPGVVARLGRAARKAYERAFTVDKIADQYLTVLATVV